MNKEKFKEYRARFYAFASSDKGKRFFNFAYSIGAAIVILGALFKILHLTGGNFMLSLGMGIEVVMFIMTAFDAPPKDYKWEEVFPVLKTADPKDRPQLRGGIGGGGGTASGVTPAPGVNVPEVAGGVVYAAAPGVPYVSPEDAKRSAGIPSDIQLDETDTMSLSESIHKLSSAADQLSRLSLLFITCLVMPKYCAKSTCFLPLMASNARIFLEIDTLSPLFCIYSTS